ncbi:MAG: 30S ribosomal protein S1, partial [Psychroserpens sp.]
MSEKETPKAEVETTEATTVETTETQTVETPKVEVSESQANPEKFLKDFNWHNYEEGIDPVDDKQLEEFEKLVSENFVDTLDDEVVEGEVIHITDRDAIIDINAKSEGVISLNEFRYNPDLKVGDKVEVL